MTKTVKTAVPNRAGAPKPPATTVAATKTAQAKQAELQEQARLLKSMMSTTAASVVAYQQTSGDYGDMSQQSEQEWLFLNRNKANAKELSMIERALRRIKDGTYGVCARCTQTISPRRLRAVPWAECCVECQEESHGAMAMTA